MVETEPLLRAHAYVGFVDKLDAGVLSPGDIVTQRELVTLTGQPLGAVREMIPRLEAEGLIQTVPKRGLQVPAINVALIRDTFQLRRVLEREAFVSFCAQADTDALAKLARDHRDLRAEVVAGQTPFDRLLALDWAFHSDVVLATGNRILCDVHRVNQIKIRMIRSADPDRTAARMTAVLDEHLAVIYALQARNPGRTVGAIHAHLENARKRALGV